MFRREVTVPIKFLGISGCGGSASKLSGTRPRAPRGRPTSTSPHYESSRRRGGGGAGSRTPRRAACFFFDVVAPALLTVKPGPWCASGAGWRRSSWRPWGGTCAATVRVAVGRTRDSEREEAAARRARLGEARRPRMPAEPRRPAALPSEPAREARRRRPHSLDAGLVPDRGRDEAQRGEPRGGEGRGAHRDLARIAGAAVRRRRAWRRCRGLCSSGCARRLVRVAPRAVEAGGDQNAA